MGIKPLPSLEEAFNMVKNEESRKALLQLTPRALPSADALAMVIRGNLENESRGKKFLRCDHCNKNGHTRDTCWKIHGKPAHSRHRTKGDSKGMTVSNMQDGEFLNQEEVSILRKILDKYTQDKTSDKTTPQVTLAHAGLSLGEGDWQS
ncbi:uncharacterized protein LOC114756168 [Neltuma alba]|uniref:uncharacterized protein LOC114756168 n=1 Tax=Neltuma alba TaxID=207710 RepID=UPI0010A363F3|nr:uncharacterized protein LOC114756168 [Prosopis alba]